MEMMSEPRTTEQIAADENLSDAIQKNMEAYDIIGDGFVISDFIVLGSVTKLNSDGVVVTSYPILMRDGDIPWYRVLGLISIHKSLADAAINIGGNNG